MGQKRLTKEQRRSIKSSRRISKTLGYREGEKILGAIRQNRELFDYSPEAK